MIQIKHNKLRIPTGGRLTSWLFTMRGGVEFGATGDKSIQWQGRRFEPGTSGLPVQCPSTRPRSPPCNIVIVILKFQRPCLLKSCHHLLPHVFSCVTLNSSFLSFCYVHVQPPPFTIYSGGFLTTFPVHIRVFAVGSPLPFQCSQCFTSSISSCVYLAFPVSLCCVSSAFRHALRSLCVPQ